MGGEASHDHPCLYLHGWHLGLTLRKLFQNRYLPGLMGLLLSAIPSPDFNFKFGSSPSTPGLPPKHVPPDQLHWLRVHGRACSSTSFGTRCRCGSFRATTSRALCIPSAHSTKAHRCAQARIHSQHWFWFPSCCFSLGVLFPFPSICSYQCTGVRCLSFRG